MYAEKFRVDWRQPTYFALVAAVACYCILAVTAVGSDALIPPLILVAASVAWGWRFAHDNGDVTSDMAWRVALRPLENADRERDAYLDRPQRTALLASAAEDAAQFLRGLAFVATVRLGYTVADMSQR